MNPKETEELVRDILRDPNHTRACVSCGRITSSAASTVESEMTNDRLVCLVCLVTDQEPEWIYDPWPTVSRLSREEKREEMEAKANRYGMDCKMLEETLMDGCPYQYRRVGGGWRKVWPGVEGIGEISHADRFPDVMVIDPPPEGRHVDLAYYLTPELHWRTTAAVGMAPDRFGQHFFQGLLYGFILGIPVVGTIPGAVLLWLAVVYQRRESDDINDKAWWDIRGLSTGATVGALLSLPLSVGVAAWWVQTTLTKFL